MIFRVDSNEFSHPLDGFPCESVMVNQCRESASKAMRTALQIVVRDLNCAIIEIFIAEHQWMYIYHAIGSRVCCNFVLLQLDNIYMYSRYWWFIQLLLASLICLTILHREWVNAECCY